MVMSSVTQTTWVLSVSPRARYCDHLAQAPHRFQTAEQPLGWSCGERESSIRIYSHEAMVVHDVEGNRTHGAGPE